MTTGALETVSQHSIVILELLGTTAFAVSGVLSALRKRMDLVGICVCGFLAAFGGGTLRDVLLDRRPFFWVEHQGMLLTVLAISIGTAVLIPRKRLELGQRWLQVPDAIGLGLFCATGVHLSSTMGQPPLVAIMMGVITATFGGVLRDLVCNEIPDLFRDHRPYAVCAVAGGVGYTLLSAAEVPPWLPVATCAAVTSTLRILALRYDWRLPATGG
jgi:uncharacterized membrane protein YeiH